MIILIILALMFTAVITIENRTNIVVTFIQLGTAYVIGIVIIFKSNAIINKTVSEIEFQLYTQHAEGFSSTVILASEHDPTAWRVWDGYILEHQEVPSITLQAEPEYPRMQDYLRQHPRGTVEKVIVISDAYNNFRQCQYWVLPVPYAEAFAFDVGFIRLFKQAIKLPVTQFTSVDIGVDQHVVQLILMCASKWTPWIDHDTDH